MLQEFNASLLFALQSGGSGYDYKCYDPELYLHHP